MRILIRDDPEQCADWVANYIKDKIKAFKPSSARPFILGLPTGGTPVLTYKRLVSMFKRGELSFRHVVTFNMDEYVNLPNDHPESYHSFMWNHLFKHIDIDPANVFILNGNAPDLVKECQEFEDRIKKFGGIDLFLGGFAS